MSQLTDRAEALFSTDIPTQTHPEPDVTRALIDNILDICGVDECVKNLASAYGKDQFNAAWRMRWALEEVAKLEPAAERS